MLSKKTLLETPSIGHTMPSGSHIEQIRVFIDRRLRALEDNAGQSLVETVLIRNEAYCGHRFRLGEHSAVWFVEENELKFYSPDGKILEVIDSLTVNFTGFSRAA